MLDLRDVFYFVQVVDRGGFTSASKSLGLPKSTLSHRVRELEGALGVTLLNRTSRRFGMTEVGTQFYHYAQTLLQTAEVAEEAVRQRATEPSGVIRMTTAVEIAQFALKDLIPVFLKQHPKVQIVEITTDTLVDIVAEGFDLALRGHITPLQTRPSYNGRSRVRHGICLPVQDIWMPKVLLRLRKSWRSMILCR